MQTVYKTRFNSDHCTGFIKNEQVCLGYKSR